MICLLTAIGLTPGGSSTVHIYTQTIHRTTQSTKTVHRTTQFTNQEECGPCPVFASYTLVFALQLRKKHGKTSVRVGINLSWQVFTLHSATALTLNPRAAPLPPSNSVYVFLLVFYPRLSPGGECFQGRYHAAGKGTFLWTWNVRSLYSAGSLTEAARELARYKLDLVGVQEVRWDKGGTVKAGDYIFFLWKRK